MARVHFDHNATTPLRPEAREALLGALDELGGNPSSLHASGRRARQLLDEARERVAGALGVTEDEILFTSGGTEANNLALFGVLRPLGPAAGLLTTRIEHSSVLGPARRLATEGHPLTTLPVDSAGRLGLDDLLGALEDREVALVSTMAANNEVGVVNPISEISELVRVRTTGDRPLVHTDAVQALGRLPLDLADWRVDLASFSAHKVGGPVGVGVLVRRGTARIAPHTIGGGQEGELRPGTENVAGIAAAAVAIELAATESSAYAERVRRLIHHLWNEVRAVLPDACLLGPPIDANDRLPNTLNVLLPGHDGRVLVTRLDLAGLEVGAGSACASGALEPSHVLRAMGYEDEHARAGLRLSLGRTTTLDDIHTCVEILRKTLGVRT